MSIASIQSRLKKIEDIVFYDDKSKWVKNLIYIEHRGNIDNINQNQKYWLNYKNKDLVYDNVETFYKEYNVYPRKDINPIIIDIVDNSYLDKVLYDANRI